MKLQNDSNAAPIVEELRKDGGLFEYWVPSGRQSGLPDGIFFYAGFVVFIEIKVPGEKPRKNQIAWCDSHACVYRVVRSVDDAKKLKAEIVRAAELAAGFD